MVHFPNRYTGYTAVKPLIRNTGTEMKCVDQHIFF